MATPHRGAWWRLQFGLSSLLGAIALLAIFLGYQLNWIQQRHGVIHREGTALDYTVNVANEHDEMTIMFPLLDIPPLTSTKAPLFLRIFGEPGYYELFFVFDGTPLHFHHRELNDQEQAFLNRTQRLFPEAKITGYAAVRE